MLQNNLLLYSDELRSKLNVSLFNNYISHHLNSEKAGIILMQLHYWLRRKGIQISGKKGIWYYSTIEQWRYNFPNWSHSSIKNSINILEKSGLVSSCKPDIESGNQTKAFSINFMRFIELIEKVHNHENKIIKKSQLALFSEPNSSIYSKSKTELEKSNFLLSSISKFNYSPSLAKRVGGDKNSILLLQLHYWIIKNGKDIKNCSLKGLWISNSLENWSKLFHWSKNTISKCLNSLELQGLIISKKLLKKQGNQTKWYSIKLEKFNALLQSVSMEQNSFRTSEILKKKMLFGKLQKVVNPSVKNCEMQYSNFLKSYNIQNKIKKNISNKKETYFFQKNLFPYKNKSANFRLSNQQIALANSMINTWNEIMPKKMQISCTTNRITNIYNLYSQHFEGSIENWKKYCIDINSSKFLMGEKKKDFIAYFDWIIQENQIKRIKAREFGIGDRVPDNIIAENRVKHREFIRRKREKEILEKKHQISQLQARKSQKEAISILLKRITKQELEDIKVKFINDIFSNKYGDKYKFIKSQFKIKGWKTIGINIFFEEFILKELSLKHLQGKGL